jgi:hypothetical protein
VGRATIWFGASKIVDFITLFGGALVAWHARRARAQQPSIPVVGFLGASTGKRKPASFFDFC